MKLTIDIDVKPFVVPTCVKVSRADKTGLFTLPETMSLRDIDKDTLDKLCRDFRDSVFAAAGDRLGLESPR